jgi:hypothetical protein
MLVSIMTFSIPKRNYIANSSKHVQLKNNSFNNLFEYVQHKLNTWPCTIFLFVLLALPIWKKVCFGVKFRLKLDPMCEWHLQYYLCIWMGMGSGSSNRKEVRRVAKERKKQQDANKNGSPSLPPIWNNKWCH